MKPKLIKVRAAAGKIIPIVSGVAHNTAARAFTAETPIEVYARNPLIRRLLKNGDLVEDAAPIPNPAKVPAKAKKE